MKAGRLGESLRKLATERTEHTNKEDAKKGRKDKSSLVDL